MTTKVQAFLLAALLAGCAEGTENDDDGFGRDGDPVAGDGSAQDGIAADGDEEDGAAFDGEEDGTTGDGADGTDGDLGELDAGTPGDGTPADGTPADGTPGDGTPADGTPADGTPGDGNPGDGDGDMEPPPMCPALSGCNAAAALGDFNGDRSEQSPIGTTGSGSKWFRQLVREDSDGIVGLSVRYELTGLADANYDLFVYQSCSDTNPQKSQNLGAAQDRVELSWSDTWLGVDDSRTLFIEVRHASGNCSDWDLKAVKP